MLRPISPHVCHPGAGRHHSIETHRLDSIQGAAYVDGGLIGSQYDVAPLAPPPPPQRHLTVPAGRTGDARDILHHGGALTNLDNQPDNFNNYNLASMRLAANALTESLVHDLMQGGSVHSLLARSAFNNDRLANGGMIQGPGTGTSNLMTAVFNRLPVAISNAKISLVSRRPPYSR